MNRAFFLMIFFGLVYSALNGTMDNAAQGALGAGEEAIDTVLELSGAFMFFGGITNVLEKSGATRSVVRMLKRPLGWLFGKGIGDEALAAVTMNLSANMLGMGNAATPMGLKAAKLLNPKREAHAPDALCLLLVLNSTAIEIFPASVIAMRYAAGSSMATAIVWPTFVSTCFSCVTGVLLCKLCERRRKIC